MITKKFFLTNKKVIVMIFIFTFILCFLYSYISVFDVYRAIKYAFLTDNGYDKYVSKYMTKELFDHFNHPEIINKNREVKKYLHLYLLFSMNNVLHKGIMWMNYSFIIKDKQSNIITASTGIPIKVYLNRVNGKWRIERNEESP